MRARILATLEVLEHEGSLSAEQRRLVQDRLEAAIAPRDHAGRFVAVLAAFGGVLVAAGLLYLVGYHWDGFGKATKLALVFGIWAGFFAAGFALAERPGPYPKIGRAFTLAGVLGFGAAIGLVAQIYNLSAHYPWALCAWWALNVPLFLWTRSRAVQIVISALFVVWAFWHQNVWIEDHHGRSWNADFSIGALLCIALAMLFEASSALLRTARDTALARCAPPWQALAAIGALAGPYLLGFKDEFTVNAGSKLPANTALPALACALAALFIALCALARGRALAELRVTALYLGLFALLTALVLCAPSALVVVANLLALGLILYFVRVGSAAWINLGIGAFFVLVMTRYCEYLWNKLEGAYAFLATGALLLALGWFLERRRKVWVARVRGGNS
jgi:uncharacterized membrane protein